MSNIIDSIQLSGSSYDVRDKSATTVVEITQSDYDNLPSSAKTSNILYIITDGSVDYITSGQCQTQINNSITGKQDTLISGTNIKTINNESILGSGNIEIEGGGKAVSAGTNISITTGETADTINCTLPIFVHSDSGRGDIRIGTDIDANNDYYRLGIGRRIHMSSTYGSGSIAIGVAGTGSNQYNLCYGQNNVGIGRLFEIGESNTSSGVKSGCVVIGNKAKSLISNGVAIGSQTTVSGTTKTNINNQLKIDTSNQVYIYNKDNTEMICLQDQLGGGSSYTAGDGIDITNDVISVTGKVDTTAFTAHTADTTVHITAAERTSWNGAATNASNAVTALGGLKLVKLTQAQYDALVTKDSNTLYVIVN